MASVPKDSALSPLNASFSASRCLKLAYFFVLSLILAYASREFPVLDFSIYWKAVTHLVSGLDPYKLPHVSTYVKYSTPEAPMLLVWSNPLVFSLLIPFGYLTQEIAGNVYLFLSYFIPLLCGDVLLRRFRAASALTKRGILSWQSAVFIAPVLLALHGAFMGSMVVFALASVVAFSICYEDKRYVLCGVVLSFSLLRLHQLIPLYASVFGFCLAVRCYRMMASAVAGLMFSAGLVLWYQPAVFQMYREMLQFDSAVNIVRNVTNASIPNVLFALFGSAHPTILFLPSLILATAYCWLSYRKQEIVALTADGWPLLAAVVLAPYAWAHDYLLTLPFFVAAALLFNRSVGNSSAFRQKSFCVLLGAALILLGNLYCCVLIGGWLMLGSMLDNWKFIWFGLLLLIGGLFVAAGKSSSVPVSAP
jgi:hypothetical protein